MDDQVLSIIQRMDDRQLSMAENIATIREVQKHHKIFHADLKHDVEELHQELEAAKLKSLKVPEHFYKKLMALVVGTSAIVTLLLKLEALWS